MNGTNLHETAVRQMGRVEGGGETRRGRGVIGKGRGGNRHRVNVSKRGGCERVEVGKEQSS